MMDTSVSQERSFKFVAYYLMKIQLIQYYDKFVQAGLGDKECVFLKNEQLEGLDIPSAHRLLILSCFNPVEAHIVRRQKQFSIIGTRRSSTPSPPASPVSVNLLTVYQEPLLCSPNTPKSIVLTNATITSKPDVSRAENNFESDINFRSIPIKAQFKRSEPKHASNIPFLLCASESIRTNEHISIFPETPEETLKSSVSSIPRESDYKTTTFKSSSTSNKLKLKMPCILEKREHRKEGREKAPIARYCASSTITTKQGQLRSRSGKGGRAKVTSCQYHYDKKATCGSNCVGHKYFPRGTPVPRGFYAIAKGNHIESHVPVYKKYKEQSRKARKRQNGN